MNTIEKNKKIQKQEFKNDFWTQKKRYFSRITSDFFQCKSELIFLIKKISLQISKRKKTPIKRNSILKFSK